MHKRAARHLMFPCVAPGWQCKPLIIAAGGSGCRPTSRVPVLLEAAHSPLQAASLEQCCRDGDALEHFKQQPQQCGLLVGLRPPAKSLLSQILPLNNP